MRPFVQLIIVAALAGTIVPAPAADPPASRGKQDDRDTQNLVFLAPAQPIFVRVYFQVDGKGVRGVRVALAARLIKPHDKNGDGAIDKEEAKSMPPLTAVPNQPLNVLENWLAIDRDPPDDRVTADELATHLDTLLGPPFSLVPRAARPTQSVDVFSRLDANGDGRLSADELRAAPKALRKLDFDDDETFSIEELEPFRGQPQQRVVEQPGVSGRELPFVLLSGTEPIETTAARLLLRYDRTPKDRPDGKLTPADLGLSDNEIRPFDENKDGELNAAEWTALLRKPPAQIEILVEIPHRQPGRPKLTVLNETSVAKSEKKQTTTTKADVALGGLSAEFRTSTGAQTAALDNRSFYRLEFLKRDADKNKYLDEMEFAGIVQNADFKAVDRNGDGMIMVEELLEFVDQESASSQARVVMSVADDGKSLFEVLDANLDRRLSGRELVHGSERLQQYDRDRDGTIVPAELAGRYRITFELGKPLLFQQTTTMADTATVPLARPPTAGPDWFRKMDRNRDGDVSRREFLGPVEVFKKLDADGDGLITAAEAEAASSSR